MACLCSSLTKRQGGVDVPHVENKLGIHGSPANWFTNAKAELLRRSQIRFDQICDGADERCRLGIAAQSVGLSQAAYNEGLAYAKERKQFGKAIIDSPAVYDMLSIMKAKLVHRQMPYCVRLRYVDNYKALDDIARRPGPIPEERREQENVPN